MMIWQQVGIVPLKIRQRHMKEFVIPTQNWKSDEMLRVAMAIGKMDWSVDNDGR